MRNGRQGKALSRNGNRPERVGAVPVEATNLSADERALLADPGWVTEDDADAVVARRRRREKTIPLEQLLRRHGSGRLAR